MKRNKRKREFSKFMVLLCWCTLICALGLNFMLLLLGRDPMSDVLVALIGGVCGGSNIGYLAQNAIRNVSLNRHGLKVVDGGETVRIEE